MSINVSTLSFEKALALALFAEYDSETIYTKLLGLVQNFVMQDKLKFLIEEEKKHQRMLESMYRKLFPDNQLVRPEFKAIPDLVFNVTDKNNVVELLEMAMQAEKRFEELYDSLSGETDDASVSQLFHYLSGMEHGHYFLVKGEYELCLENEMYYQRDDFEFDMVHIGP